jgi:hypothetical protein
MLAWLLLFASLVGASPEQRLHDGTRALDELRLEEAAAALESVVADPEATEDVRAQAFLALGLTRASLLDETGARTAFAAALAIDPRLDLPDGTSPKVRALFESTRATVLPGGVPAPRPAAKKPPDIAPPTTNASPPPAPVPAPDAPSRTPWLIGGGVLVGMGAVAGGAALLADASLGAPVAGRTRDEYETTRSLGVAAFASSVLFGAAGALTLAGSLALVDPPAEGAR